MKLKPITGSFMEFYHHNPLAIWREDCCSFNNDDWRIKVREMAFLGLDTIIVTSVALKGIAFFPTKLIPQNEIISASDPLGAVLDEASKCKMRVFVGLGFFNERSISAMDPNDFALTKAIAEELLDKYGHYTSFYGWYLPEEGHIPDYFTPRYENYVGHCQKILASLGKMPILISPYGTRTAKADAKFSDQLKNLGADIVAYQDEVGVLKTSPDELPQLFASLAKAHALAGVELWANVEAFRFETIPYRSRALPAEAERLIQQITAVSPYVSKIITYQYLGLMNPASSHAFAGPTSSIELYNGYLEFKNTL